MTTEVVIEYSFYSEGKEQSGTATLTVPLINNDPNLTQAVATHYAKQLGPRFKSACQPCYEYLYGVSQSSVSFEEGQVTFTLQGVFEAGGCGGGGPMTTIVKGEWSADVLSSS